MRIQGVQASFSATPGKQGFELRVTGCGVRVAGYLLREKGVLNIEYRTRNIEPQK